MKNYSSKHISAINSFLFISRNITVDVWMDGWMDGWVGGSVGGWDVLNSRSIRIQ